MQENEDIPPFVNATIETIAAAQVPSTATSPTATMVETDNPIESETQADIETGQDDTETQTETEQIISSATKLASTLTSTAAASATAVATNLNAAVSTWWSSFVVTAKEKSINAIEVVRNDLTEFTSTVKNDINQVAANEKLFQNIPQKIQNFTQNLTKDHSTGGSVGHNVSTHGTASTTAQSKLMNTARKLPTTQVSGGSYNRFQEELEALQLNENTYLVEPKAEEHADYATWLSNYDPDHNKGEISNLLIENVKLRAIYSKLVPAFINNKDFWSRYFYKKKCFEDEQKKRLDLIERATSKVIHEEDLSWDEEEEEELEEVEDAVGLDEKEEEAIINEALETKCQTKDEEQQNIEQELVDEVSNTVNTDDNDDVNRNDSLKNVDKKSISSDEWEKEFEVSPTPQTAHETNARSGSTSSNNKNDSNVKAATALLAAKTNETKESEDWESWD